LVKNKKKTGELKLRKKWWVGKRWKIAGKNGDKHCKSRISSTPKLSEKKSGNTARAKRKRRYELDTPLEKTVTT
jgi:hypothetical protein